MIEELAQIFDGFLTNITNNQWSYIFIGLIIFIILLICLTNMIKN